jgi:hypothetical protein
MKSLRCKLFGHTLVYDKWRYCTGEHNEEWREQECIVCGKTLQVEDCGHSGQFYRLIDKSAK